MDDLLQFLIDHMSYLYKEFGFRIVDSEASKSFGSGYIIFQLGGLQARLISDKSQIFLDFHSIYTDKKNVWHSWEVVVPLITEQTYDSAVLDGPTASNDPVAPIIKENLSDIINLFAPENASGTIARITQFEKEGLKKKNIELRTI